MGSLAPWRWASRPSSTKWFGSLFLGLLGLAYAAFLGGIWADTRMEIPLIIEAYRDMSPDELVRHSSQYLVWFTMAFAVIMGALFLTSYPERVKKFFAIWTPFWIVADIAAAWLIRQGDFFAYQLFVSGFVLAATFLVLFMLVQRDIWFKSETVT